MGNAWLLRCNALLLAGLLTNAIDLQVKMIVKIDKNLPKYLLTLQFV